MQQGLKELLDKRRNRAMAMVLGVKERECDRFLPAASAAKLRKVVLDQFNDLTELVLDIVDSLDTGDVALNEVWLQQLDEVHRAVVRTNGHR